MIKFEITNIEGHFRNLSIWISWKRKDVWISNKHQNVYL